MSWVVCFTNLSIIAPLPSTEELPGSSLPQQLDQRSSIGESFGFQPESSKLRNKTRRQARLESVTVSTFVYCFHDLKECLKYMLKKLNNQNQLQFWIILKSCNLGKFSILNNLDELALPCPPTRACPWRRPPPPRRRPGLSTRRKVPILDRAR